MQFTPTASELDSLVEMDDTERLHYFLTRTVEAEEVWALADQEGWILQEQDDHTILQVWPYELLANNYMDTPASYYPSATSLDHFVYTLLAHMSEQDIELEILPLKQTTGIKISAAKLNQQYESMLEAGDYYLEG